MDKTTAQFAAYAAALSYADLTPEAVHATKRLVVDSIGCAFGAFDAEPVRAIRSLASKVTATAPATLIGTRIKSSPELAGFVNGAMTRYLDFSDDYFGVNSKQAGPHPSDNIGSVLAATESIGENGKSLILGIALAYEACAQLVEYTVIHPQGWDYPVMHSVATALGAGKVLGLTQEQLGNAVSLAIVPNICLWQTRIGELSHWKGLAGPNGSRAGLFAALLAKEGVTGPTEPFEGKAGFMTQLNTPFQLGDLGGKGVPFKVERAFFKYFPVMYTHQLLVWGGFELRKMVSVEDIESIVVYVTETHLNLGGFDPDKWNPLTRETADHSGPFLLAAALLDGDITAETMTPRRYRDPDVLALIQKIEVREDKAYTAAYPPDRNCRIEATLKSGKVVSVHQSNPKGDPANPLSDAEIEDKFLRQVDSLFTRRQSRKLLDSLWNLENMDDLAKLFALMVVKTSRK